MSEPVPATMLAPPPQYSKLSRSGDCSKGEEPPPSPLPVGTWLDHSVHSSGGGGGGGGRLCATKDMWVLLAISLGSMAPAPPLMAQT